METKDFIDKTNDIVKLLMNAAGSNNLTSVARIVTKQADMDCDGLIDECNEVIIKLKKAKIELMGLKQQCNQEKDINDFKTTWEWIDTFERESDEWREAFNLCKKYHDKYNCGDPIEYLNQIIEEHNKWRKRK